MIKAMAVAHFNGFPRPQCRYLFTKVSLMTIAALVFLSSTDIKLCYYDPHNNITVAHGQFSTYIIAFNANLNYPKLEKTSKLLEVPVIEGCLELQHGPFIETAYHIRKLRRNARWSSFDWNLL